MGAVLLFLINLRRAGETAGRHAERLKQMERQHDIQRRMLEAASNRPRDRDELADRLRDGFQSEFNVGMPIAIFPPCAV